MESHVNQIAAQVVELLVPKIREIIAEARQNDPDTKRWREAMDESDRLTAAYIRKTGVKP